jgi:hypothetical protein
MGQLAQFECVRRNQRLTSFFCRFFPGYFPSLAEVEAYRRERGVLLQQISDATARAAREKQSRIGEVLELQKQLDEMKNLLFNCRGKADATERSKE